MSGIDCSVIVSQPFYVTCIFTYSMTIILPIMLALCLMLSGSYYAQNYASIIGWCLLVLAITVWVYKFIILKIRPVLSSFFLGRRVSFYRNIKWIKKPEVLFEVSIGPLACKLLPNKEK